jgi:hypothetical protein
MSTPEEISIEQARQELGDVNAVLLYPDLEKAAAILESDDDFMKAIGNSGILSLIAQETIEGFTAAEAAISSDVGFDVGEAFNTTVLSVCLAVKLTAKPEPIKGISPASNPAKIAKGLEILDQDNELADLMVDYCRIKTHIDHILEIGNNGPGELSFISWSFISILPMIRYQVLNGIKTDNANEMHVLGNVVDLAEIIALDAIDRAFLFAIRIISGKDLRKTIDELEPQKMDEEFARFLKENS